MHLEVNYTRKTFRTLNCLFTYGRRHLGYEYSPMLGHLRQVLVTSFPIESFTFQEATNFWWKLLIWSLYMSKRILNYRQKETTYNEETRKHRKRCVFGRFLSKNGPNLSWKWICFLFHDHVLGVTICHSVCVVEHTCAYARWAHMHRFLSVCLSVTGPKFTRS